MPSYFEDVRDFHRKFAFGWSSMPIRLPSALWAERIRLILEELKEVAEAQVKGDLVGFSDGLADLVYVVLGTAVEAGIPFDEVWAVVHASNMAKDGGIKDAGGKLVKPDGWVPPDIASILEERR